MAVCEIVTIGTELLLGEIQDTNSRFIARSLRDIGVDLYRLSTVGDNVQRITATLQEALMRADIVITTGGLGPTVDDPTRQAVANVFNVKLVYKEEVVATNSKPVQPLQSCSNGEQQAPGFHSGKFNCDTQSSRHRSGILC